MKISNQCNFTLWNLISNSTWIKSIINRLRMQRRIISAPYLLNDVTESLSLLLDFCLVTGSVVTFCSPNISLSLSKSEQVKCQIVHISQSTQISRIFSFYVQTNSPSGIESSLSFKYVSKNSEKSPFLSKSSWKVPDSDIDPSFNTTMKSTWDKYVMPWVTKILVCKNIGSLAQAIKY